MKNKLTSRKIIKEIEKKKKELKRFGVKRIGLFGSFVKDKQNQKSDVDFLVEFDKINLKNYMGLLFTLEKLFRKKIDLVIESDLKPELKYVKKEAVYVKV